MCLLFRLTADAAEGMITKVICTHPDRLSRDLTDKLIVVREFEKNGADIVFTDTYQRCTRYLILH